MHEQLQKTKQLLEELRSWQGQNIYLTFTRLIESLRQDIRLHNDVEENTDQMLRNQGGIWWFGDLLKQMQMDVTKRPKPTDTNIDGGYIS